MLPAVLALAGSVPASAPAVDFSSAEWRYFKPIDVPGPPAGEGLVEFVLDREAFRGSAAGQPDLRLVGRGGRETAYRLTVARGRKGRTRVPVKLRDLGHLPGEHTGFVVDLGGDGRLHNEVEILVGDSNFRRETQVEASADARNWYVLQKGTEIFDFTVPERDFSARNARVGYPESAARYLRVRIFDGDEAPLEVTGAEVALARDVPARETPYAPERTIRTEDAAARASVLVLDLGGPGIPTGRLSFRAASSGFHRDVSVAGSDDREDWRRLRDDAEIYSYSTPRFSGERLDVAYPESAYRYYRATIRNRNDRPIRLEGATLHGAERRIVFRARPGEEYALYYGNPNARRPSYDLERILPYLETGDLPAATLGAQRTNPAFAGPRLPWEERYPWAIPSAVAVAMLAVGALLFRVLRQAGKAFPPPD